MYESSFHADVTIWNHQYIITNKAISAKIPSTRFTAHFTTLTNASFCCVFVSIRFTHLASQLSEVSVKTLLSLSTAKLKLNDKQHKTIHHKSVRNCMINRENKVKLLFMLIMFKLKIQQMIKSRDSPTKR